MPWPPTSKLPAASRFRGAGWARWSIPSLALGTALMGIVLVSCSGGDAAAPGSAPSTTTSTSTPASRDAPPVTGATVAAAATSEANGPRIVTLDIEPTVQCIGPASVEVDVAYEATGADRVIFLVDDQQVPGVLPAGGTARIPLECDGGIHVIVATAIAPDGRTGVESKAVQTDTEPPPE